MSQKPFVLGLTGSIGMGKTTVSTMFRNHGVPVLEADEVVHKIYAIGGSAVEPLSRSFPLAIVNGAVDRQALSAYVIGNEKLMLELEGIVHPLVNEEREQFIAQVADEGHSLVVLDIPLLYETSMERSLSAVLVVSAPFDVQKMRVMSRPNMTKEKFDAILARQVPDAEKRARADFMIDTSSSLEETEKCVISLIEKLKTHNCEEVNSK